MKALVIGGNGFIGSHLVDRLLAGRWETTVLDVNGRRYESLPPSVRFIHGSFDQPYLLREALIGVEVVYHLAWATIHEVSNRDPAADVLANLIPSIRLLEACANAGVQRIVFTSSGGTIYGAARSLPITEEHPQRPINGYGITKLAFEKYLHMFRHLYGQDYAIFRPSVPYGPRQNPLGAQGAVAVFLYRVARGLEVSIWGDGETTRDYFFVADLIDALMLGATAALGEDRVFNIGGTQRVSLNQLLRRVESVVGRPATVTYHDRRSFDAPDIALDTSRARAVLKWAPTVSLARGLELTWNWMAETVFK